MKIILAVSELGAITAAVNEHFVSAHMFEYREMEIELISAEVITEELGDDKNE